MRGELESRRVGGPSLLRLSETDFEIDPIPEYPYGEHHLCYPAVTVCNQTYAFGGLWEPSPSVARISETTRGTRPIVIEHNREDE
jgi:hypothetical protein